MTGPAPGRPLVAGVELGGGKCVCLLASGPDDVRDRVRIETVDPEPTLAAIDAALRRWRGAHDVAALGIASFGPLHLDPDAPDFGRLGATPKRGWEGADLLGLAAAIAGPCGLDTDVNGAARAEARWGAARGLDAFAYVTVGTGVGVGVIVDGRPIRGLGHSEAGHMRVPRRAGADWAGTCPYHGDCVEGLASGSALAKRTGRSAATLDDDDAAWADAVHALTGLFHNLVLTTAPARILLGGGVALGRPRLLPRLRAGLRDSLAGYAHAAVIDPALDRFLVAPGLGADAGPLGAVAIAQDALAAE